MSEILMNKACFTPQKRLEVSNAFPESSVLLSWSDGLLDIGDDPVHHVLLFHPPHDVGSLQLVVQTLLDLLVSLHQPGPVYRLQLKADGLLLSRDNVLPGGSVSLGGLL